MKTLITMMVLSLSVATFADKPSKKQMKKNLDEYVKKNQEASVQIMPLIERVKEILSGENTTADKAPRNPATEGAKEEAH